MKKIKFLIILIIPLLLSGCYNYRELNTLAITTSLSIDYDEKANEFITIAQVANPIKQQDITKEGQPAFVNYEVRDKSVQEAFRKVILESPKKLYGSHLQILILSDTAIKNALPEILDFFIRDPEIRSEFKVVIAKDKKALEAATLQTLLDESSSSKLLKSLELQNEHEGTISLPTINELTNMYLNPNLEIILPSIYVEGDISEGQEDNNKEKTIDNTTPKVGTMTIFKDCKLIDYLSTEDSFYLNLIRGEVKNSIINMKDNNGYIIFEPNMLKSKLELDLKKNEITLNVKGHSRVNEVSAMVDLTDKEEIKTLQKKLNNMIEENTIKSFNNIRDKYNTDAFGFKDLYYKKDPKKDYSNWYDNDFKNVKFKVKSNIKLYEKGNILGGIKYERENQ